MNLIYNVLGTISVFLFFLMVFVMMNLYPQLVVLILVLMMCAFISYHFYIPYRIKDFVKRIKNEDKNNE